MFLIDYINSLDRQVEILQRIKRKTVLQLVRDCKHEEIVTSENDGRWPWQRNHSIKCVNCGVTVYGDGCGVFKAPLLHFTDSRIIIRKQGEIFLTRLNINHELMHALQFPRRFTNSYLKYLMSQTPWSVEEVMVADKGNYSILCPPFDSHMQWYNEYYTDGD